MRPLPFAPLACLLLSLCLAGLAHARELPDPDLRERDRQRLDAALAALEPERPGQPDLYAIGFGGDSEENVFRNEAAYFERMMNERFGAKGRTIALINHADSLGPSPHPLATPGNLRAALAAVGKRMDPEQDILLLFLTMHGTAQHQLLLRMAPKYVDLIDPDWLRKALDDAGIRNRVLVISACYAGGFIPRLENDDTLILTAAHRSRTSFGCGADSDATYFGRAWLIEGLNATTDFAAAFEQAKLRIADREREGNFKPSRPQMEMGDRIAPKLAAWRAQLVPGPVIAYAPPVSAPLVTETPAAAEPPKSNAKPQMQRKRRKR
jgi:hypothetical protein